MKERPILFNGENVRAILDGRKTQTRRVVAWSNSYVDGQITKEWRGYWEGFDFDRAWIDPGPSPAGNAGPYLHVPFPGCDDETVHRIYPRYQVGERLWVRETWAKIYDTEEGEEKGPFHFEYKASADFKYPGGWPDDEGDSPDCAKWKPSIHMPRKAARLIPEVKSVRLERLQDISPTDVVAEGIVPTIPDDFGFDEYIRLGEQQFQPLWNSLNAKRGYPWKSNPWVWVIGYAA